MSDDDELETGMIPALVDNAGRRHEYKVAANASGETYSTRLEARASMFSVSRAFVGSSNAKMPQFCPNESDRANLMTMEANIF